MTDNRKLAERLRELIALSRSSRSPWITQSEFAKRVEQIADELDAAGSERDEELEELAKDADHAHEFMEAHNLHDAGMKIMGRRLRALKDEA